METHVSTQSKYVLSGKFISVNICIDRDTFYNFRISHVDTDYFMALYIELDGCELYLIAKDGIPLNDELKSKENITFIFYNGYKN